VGVAGNGQTELCGSHHGTETLSSGQIILFGKPLQESRSLNMEEVGYIPEDRLGMGSIPSLTLVDNLILTSYLPSTEGDVPEGGCR